MIEGHGSPAAVISEDGVRQIIEAGTPPVLYDKKRVLVLTPDATRTCPLPMMIRAVREMIGRRCAKLDFMVAHSTRVRGTGSFQDGMFTSEKNSVTFCRQIRFKSDASPNPKWRFPSTMNLSM